MYALDELSADYCREWYLEPEPWDSGDEYEEVEEDAEWQRYYERYQ